MSAKNIKRNSLDWTSAEIGLEVEALVRESVTLCQGFREYSNAAFSVQTTCSPFHLLLTALLTPVATTSWFRANSITDPGLTALYFQSHLTLIVTLNVSSGVLTYRGENRLHETKQLSCSHIESGRLGVSCSRSLSAILSHPLSCRPGGQWGWKQVSK